MSTEWCLFMQNYRLAHCHSEICIVTKNAVQNVTQLTGYTPISNRSASGVWWRTVRVIDQFSPRHILECNGLFYFISKWGDVNFQAFLERIKFCGVSPLSYTEAITQLLIGPLRFSVMSSTTIEYRKSLPCGQPWYRPIFDVVTT